MKTNVLGYPRIGAHRELKGACEAYWAGKTDLTDLQRTAQILRRQHWQFQQQAGVDLIPSNDFSLYDQVLDTALMVSAVPERYHPLVSGKNFVETDLYFAMARGYQQNGHDITALEMTKWFDTNYHYLVPEFRKNQPFSLLSEKPVHEFLEARSLGIHTKLVLIGPVSFLLLGKEKEAGFHRIDLLDNLLPVYLTLLQKLERHGATWVQFDEPFLAMDLTEAERNAFRNAYQTIKRACPGLKTIITAYFEGYRDNLDTALSLPVCALHLDLVRCPDQLDAVLEKRPENLTLSLGLVDGRNIWKNDYVQSLLLLDKVLDRAGNDRVMVATSCSLLHVPYDLELETNESALPAEVKNWMAFAKQKVEEVVALATMAGPNKGKAAKELLEENQRAQASRRQSSRIHRPSVQQQVAAITPDMTRRQSPFSVRQQVQQHQLQLPLLPATTIGSFPQTRELRQLRAKWKKGELTGEQYETALEERIRETIHLQETIGLDVLVHGEFERNDMVEYFGEQLQGFVFTENGWVQSYGSRAVKPPIIVGDVERKTPMTVRWSAFAQSLTDKPVKGMLTGPITILQWSFVRNDQTRKQTALQIALAIRGEVQDLEKAGIRVIQIDEPAIREGLPLRRQDWETYLQWAVQAFLLATSGVKDGTQIHTHMCYSEFNDIIQAIADLDADVITIETSRSQMELLQAFAYFNYPNEIGPGVYDIHSPRVPLVEEMQALLEKALEVLPLRNLWVNPDCGLKTRAWPETEAALKNMVQAARALRETLTVHG